MKRWLTNLWLIVSLAMLAILAGGYITSINLVVNIPRREVQIGTDYGRVRVWITNSMSTPNVSVRNWRFRPAQRFWPPRLPDLKRSIWEFDAHWLVLTTSPFPMRIYLLACPIWCVALPFAIAPALWVRRKRRERPERRGFDVEPANTTAAA